MHKFFILLIFFSLMTQYLVAGRYSYSYIPKKIYSTQVFPITILAKNSDKNIFPVFSFDSDSGIKPLESAPARVINGNDIFYTFYFQVDGSNDFRLPELFIKEPLITNNLPGRLIRVEDLDVSEHPDFCGLIASDCTILSSQVSSFDNNSTLVSIKFKAHEANPNAIMIPTAIEGGLEKMDRKNALISAEYYFVIPSHQKDINLSYFNTVERRFITTTIRTDYHNRPVAAQVALNPKASPFDKLKKYGSIALSLFFALMYWWKRDMLYLSLLIIVSFLIYTAYKSNEIICVEEGSSLYILPTHNSRTSTTVDEELHINSLEKHGDYYKINYHNGTIGWINEEDFCKD